MGFYGDFVNPKNGINVGNPNATYHDWGWV